jgi:hypothetical protein
MAKGHRQSIYFEPVNWDFAGIGAESENRSVSNFLETLVLQYKEAHPELFTPAAIADYLAREAQKQAARQQSRSNTPPAS